MRVTAHCPEKILSFLPPQGVDSSRNPGFLHKSKKVWIPAFARMIDRG